MYINNGAKCRYEATKNPSHEFRTVREELRELAADIRYLLVTECSWTSVHPNECTTDAQSTAEMLTWRQIMERSAKTSTLIIGMVANGRAAQTTS